MEINIVEKKEFKFGNSIVIVHSSLVNMTSKERQNWYQQEWEKGNPILKQIVESVQECAQNGKKGGTVND